MAHIITDIVIKPRVGTSIKKLSCMCKSAKAEGNNCYDKEGIKNRLEKAKIAKEKLDAENAMREKNIRKYGEAAKAYALAKKQF